MSLRDLDERDLLVTEPESLTVGQLNRAVRLLRERLHLALAADAAHPAPTRPLPRRAHGEIPRRNCPSLYAPMERAVRAAFDVIESGPADVRLTRAGNAMQDALAWVADYYEDVPVSEHYPRPADAAHGGGNEVVCGDHWHGLSGEPVNGATGCPWCLLEETEAAAHGGERARGLKFKGTKEEFRAGVSAARARLDAADAAAAPSPAAHGGEEPPGAFLHEADCTRPDVRRERHVGYFCATCGASHWYDPPAAHGGERARALDEDGAPAGIILRRRVESLAARYGATRRDITFAGQQVAETLRSLLIYPSAECPATVTGNPLDCGGCPEHAAPAAAPSPEAPEIHGGVYGLDTFRAPSPEAEGPCECGHAREQHMLVFGHTARDGACCALVGDGLTGLGTCVCAEFQPGRSGGKP